MINFCINVKTDLISVATMAATTVGGHHAAPTGGPDPAVMEVIERGNAVVFFDVALGEGEDAVPLGRIKLELFVNDVGGDRFVLCNERKTGLLGSAIALSTLSVSLNLTSLVEQHPHHLFFYIRSVPRRVRTFDSSVLGSFNRTTNPLATRAARSIACSKGSSSKEGTL